MEQKNKNIVIGICSPSGGGKTTLVKILSELIEGSVSIHFDDYGDPFWNIGNFEEWINNGADLNEIESTQLAGDLESLKFGKEIISPKSKETHNPQKFIIFDTLVGRSHQETGKFIDYLIYIDVSLELALSRRLLRSLEEIRGDDLDFEKTREKIKQLNEYLEAYSSQTGPRQIYLAIRDQVKPLADLVLNGEQQAEILADNILKALVSYEII